MFKDLKNSKQAFTMTEVVVAAIIFVLAAAGIFATASNLRRPAQESSYDVTAAMIGKEVLANLWRSIGPGVWNAVFDPDVNPHVMSNVTINGIIYAPSYNVYVDPLSNARRVEVTVEWTGTGI